MVQKGVGLITVVATRVLAKHNVQTRQDSVAERFSRWCQRLLRKGMRAGAAPTDGRFRTTPKAPSLRRISRVVGKTALPIDLNGGHAQQLVEA